MSIFDFHILTHCRIKTHKSTIVGSLLPATPVNDLLKLLDGNRGCSLQHDPRALCEDVCAEIHLREMQRHEQRRRLRLSHLVCEEVRDGFGNLSRRYLRRRRPHLGQQRLEVDHRQGLGLLGHFVRHVCGPVRFC